jgi:Flp pilus assembly protein TadG
MSRSSCHRPPVPSRRARQRGAVAIVVGLMIAVLLGFIGLALDGGHLYLTKTELQNSADACALAASYELTGAPTIPAAAFARAEAAGQAVGQMNKVDFQNSAIVSSDISVRFGTELSTGSAWLSAGAASPSSKYVRCTLTRSDIAPWFMQVLGFGAQTVSSLATATLAPAQSNCAVPMALCVQPGGSAPDYGYVVGNWYSMDFSDTGGAANYTGNFRWIDFDPSSTTPGCSGGGANELSCLLAGVGQCSLPPPTTSSCGTSGSANPTPGCVGENGAINSIQKAYNSRFGLYGPGSLSVSSAPPDFTGYSYSTENWPIGRDAYSGSVAGVPNFKSARIAHLPANDGTEVTPNVNPLFYKNPYKPSLVAQHTANGADRRLVVMPIVECAGFATGQHAPVRAYACVLLVDPYRLGPGNVVKSRLEYLGRSDVPGSPCATSGIAGDASSLGPMVPALVQ